MTCFASRELSMITLKEWYSYGNGSNHYTKGALANWDEYTLLKDVWDRCQDPRILTALLESGDHELAVSVTQHQLDQMKDPLYWNPETIGRVHAMASYTPDKREQLIKFIKKGYVMRSFYPALTCDTLRKHIRNPFV